MYEAIDSSKATKFDWLRAGVRRWCRWAVDGVLWVTVSTCIPCVATASMQTAGAGDEALSCLQEMSELKATKENVLQMDQIQILLSHLNRLLEQAGSKDPNVADPAKNALGQVADRLWNECRVSSKAVEARGTEGNARLYVCGHLGPVAFRLYLSATTDANIPRGTLLKCRNATVAVMRTCAQILETHQDLPAGEAQLTLRIMTTMCEMVTVSDLAAFRGMFVRGDNYVVGDASLRATKSIGELILDPAVREEDTRDLAIDALGAAFSAHEVFFRAMMSIVDEARRLYSLPFAKQAAAALGFSPESLLEYVDSVDAEEFTSPSRVVAYFTSLLASEQVTKRVQAAKVLGRMVPSVLVFVDTVTDVLEMIPMNIDPALSRNVFLISSSSFDAMFALADAATDRNTELREVALQALDRILNPDDPNASMTSVVQKCIVLLEPRGQADRSYEVENEAFNALLAIPLATDETIARMDTIEKASGNSFVRERAKEIRDRFTTLAERATTKIVDGFHVDTDLGNQADVDLFCERVQKQEPVAV